MDLVTGRAFEAVGFRLEIGCFLLRHPRLLDILELLVSLLICAMQFLDSREITPLLK